MSEKLTEIIKDVGETFEITDNSLVLSNLNGMRRGGPQFVHWECAEWRERGGASGWGTWRPSNGDRQSGLEFYGFKTRAKNYTNFINLMIPIFKEFMNRLQPLILERNFSRIYLVKDKF